MHVFISWLSLSVFCFFLVLTRFKLTKNNCNRHTDTHTPVQARVTTPKTIDKCVSPFLLSKAHRLVKIRETEKN